MVLKKSILYLIPENKIATNYLMRSGVLVQLILQLELLFKHVGCLSERLYSLSLVVQLLVGRVEGVC